LNRKTCGDVSACSYAAPNPQSGQFAKLETFQLDRVDNLVKILQNIGGSLTSSYLLHKIGKIKLTMELL